VFKLEELIMHNVHEVLDGARKDNGPGLIVNTIVSPGANYDFVHLCALVPSHLSKSVSDAVHEAAHSIISAEFGKTQRSEERTYERPSASESKTKFDS
jgi:hypothetical protein